MIIQLRGTGGSGKSTLVRKVMASFVRDGQIEPFYIERRKRPKGYVCRKEGQKDLYIPGHYEIECGGCDTLPTLDFVYNDIREYAAKGYNVLYEGIMAADDVNRTVALAGDFPFLAIGLTTSLEDCLEAINRRRLAKFGTMPTEKSIRNTTNRYKRMFMHYKRLEAHKVNLEHLNREEAYSRIISLIHTSRT